MVIVMTLVLWCTLNVVIVGVLARSALARESRGRGGRRGRPLAME